MCSAKVQKKAVHGPKTCTQSFQNLKRFSAGIKVQKEVWKRIIVKSFHFRSVWHVFLSGASRVCVDYFPCSFALRSRSFHFHVANNEVLHTAGYYCIISYINKNSNAQMTVKYIHSTCAHFTVELLIKNVFPAMPEPTGGRIQSQNLSVNCKAHQSRPLAETTRRMLCHLTLPGVQPTTGQGSRWPRSVDSLMPRCIDLYVQSPKRSNTILCNNSGLHEFSLNELTKRGLDHGNNFPQEGVAPSQWWWQLVGNRFRWTQADRHVSSLTELKRFRAASRSTIWRNGPDASEHTLEKKKVILCRSQRKIGSLWQSTVKGTRTRT